MSATRRAAATLAAVVLAALPLLTGCGIRTTTVPVDAGPAPSRVSCAVPRAGGTAPEPDTVARPVYLVCSQQAAPVSRNVPIRDGSTDRLAQVRILLGQLQRSPLSAEAQAGFSTEVPGNLEILGPFKGDPKGALRLSQPLDELPSFALAQLVCTLAANPLIAPGHALILGGSGAGTAVRGFTCTPDLRTRPDAADSAGTAVR